MIMNLTPPHPDHAVSIRGLTKRYGNGSSAKMAVDALDLDVFLGEVFCLLGPNGAGKTTTVEILEGFRRFDAGTVNVLGVTPSSDNRAWKARLGIVGQDTSQRGELTVSEIITWYTSFYPHPRPVEQVIELVGLADKRNARTRTLSGGQRRRVDVALALVGHPQLLFLDEPTTGFDPQARRAFWQMIKDLKAEGTTMILTTHYLEEAEALADRVGVMAQGKLVALDTPSQLGGRDRISSVVSWQDNNGRHEEKTDAPTALLAQLMAQTPPGQEIADLRVRRPTLEEIYLQMITKTTTGDVAGSPEPSKAFS